MNTPIKRLGFCVALIGVAFAIYGALNLRHFQSIEGCLRYGGNGSCPALRGGSLTFLAGLVVMFLLGPLGSWILNGRRKR